MDRNEYISKSEQPKEYMYVASTRLTDPRSELTDEDLVQQFQEGNKDAFRLLVERNQDKVRSIVLYTLNRDDLVDDVAQDIFIKVYRALDDFRFDSKFYTWLYRIAVNTCRDELRKRRWKKFISLNSSPRTGEPIHLRELTSEHTYDDFKDAVHTALKKLPARHREIIVLKDIEDHTYEEIADILRCELGTVKSRLSRARAVLRKLLEPFISEET
jgi:RNA polymerase sigma-70 factor, ECF subfamily